MEIRIALVHHKYGVDLVFGKSLEGVYKSLAKYCRDNWEYERDSEEFPIPNNDQEVIDKYFEYSYEEYYEMCPVNTDEIPD